MRVMTSPRKSLPALILMVLMFTVAPAGVLAQANQDPQREGVLVRVQGTAVVSDGESLGVVVSVDGDAIIEGEVDVVVVVDGTATLAGARVGDLVVVNGDAELTDGTVVTGDVWLTTSDLQRSEDVVIEGTVNENAASSLGRLTGWAAFFSALFFVGIAVLALLFGLLAAGIAGDQLRRSSWAITRDFGFSFAAGLIVWLVVPAIAVGLAFTIVGIPVTVFLFVFALPAVFVLSLIVAATRIGDLIVGSVRKGALEARPYLAVVIGVVLLLIVGLIPFLGALVIIAAGFIGGGAIGLVAFRTLRGQGPPPAESREPAPASLA